MPAYCDSHPVPFSPYGHGVPVHLDIAGPDEHIVGASVAMELEWEVQPRLAADNTVRLEQLGWRAEDWRPAAQSIPPSSAAIVLCLDTNVLLSHLPFLKRLYQALCSYLIPADGFAFLIAATVLRELDGLKSASGHNGAASAAQQAVGWLASVKVAERQQGIGKGLLVGDELDMNLYAMEDNDGLILAAAQDTRRRSPPGTAVLLWTGDANLRARAELQNVHTVNPRLAPTDPAAFLSELRVRVGGAKGGVDRVNGDSGGSSSSNGAASPHIMYTNVLNQPSSVREDVQSLPSSSVAQFIQAPSSTHTPFPGLLPFEALALTLHMHFPPATIARLESFQQAAPDAYDGSGLPLVGDLRRAGLTLPMCFESLERIWRYDAGGWRASDLATRKRRRKKPASLPSEPPPASSYSPHRTTGSSNHISMHAGPSRINRSPSKAPLTAPPDDADLLPPSASHIRTTLLPLLAHFTHPPPGAPPLPRYTPSALRRASVPELREHVLPLLPAFGEPGRREAMPAFLEALEAVFLHGQGGRTFLGETGHAELVDCVEGCWEFMRAHGLEAP